MGMSVLLVADAPGEGREDTTWDFGLLMPVLAEEGSFPSGSGLLLGDDSGVSRTLLW